MPPSLFTERRVSILFDVMTILGLLGLLVGILVLPQTNLSGPLFEAGLIWFVVGMAGNIITNRIYPSYRDWRSGTTDTD